MYTTKVKFRAAIALTSAVMMLTAACGEDSSGSNRTVRFTVFTGATTSWGVYIADAMGFFKTHGVNIKYVSVGSGSSAMQVVASGDTDFALSDATITANASKTGLETQFVAGQFKRFAAELACQPGLTTGSYPESMRALKGKTIGYTAPGSGSDFYLQYSLMEAGVDPADVERIPVGGAPQLIAAYRATSVDCVTAYQPMQQELGDASVPINWQEGEGPAEFSDYLLNGVVASKKYIDGHEDEVRAVALAMKDAAEFASDPANAEEIAKATVKFFPGSNTTDLAAIAEEIADAYTYSVTEQQVASAAIVYKAVTGEDYPLEYADIVAEPARNIIG
ncbi:ABC transporter substrate-binding protein [Streptomyces sp. NPDC001982]|uniref:ABC transporter substrate-binding protein n=1 Tax=Streptomyces sp. NPDC001982 TaxID=3154405 RepID=UPI00333397F9